jgi:hypothetical protein
VSPARPAPEPDRLALLQRGKTNRAVKRRDAHLEVAETLDITAVPAPYDPRGDGALDDDERADLATCEQAVAGLQRALAAAGKALATINAARLYRDTHGTFEAYVEDRWGMKRANAYRLMKAWPVAAALSPIGDTNEGQVRELLPAAKRHGIEAAVAVYAELHEQGGRITAARIHEAVRALPPRLAAPEQARDVLRAAAASGRLTPPAPRPAPDDDVVDAEIVGEDTSAIADLATLLDRQKRLYDDLGGGLVDRALQADAGAAEELLRGLSRYAGRTAHRARTAQQSGE